MDISERSKLHYNQDQKFILSIISAHFSQTKLTIAAKKEAGPIC